MDGALICCLLGGGTGYTSQFSVLLGRYTMLQGILFFCSLILHLAISSYVGISDEDETIYVDSDDELNKEFTKVEVIEYGR